MSDLRRMTRFVVVTATLSVWLLGCDDTERPTLSNCGDLTRNGDETDVDCGGSCDPCDNGRACQVNEDCLSGNCNLLECRPAGVVCDDGERSGSETDVDCGGDCPPCEEGMSCHDDGDCQSGICSDGTCVAPACDDGMLNGDETDIDCGGGCPGCAPGQSCQVDSDCASNDCTDGQCSEPDCTDGEQNYNETDVDCGGRDCDPCEDDKACLEDNDCVSLHCEVSESSGEGVCVAASCDDLITNGEETDIDCGGTECDPCAVGANCEAGSDCSSLVCADDTCQEPSCDDGVTNGAETDVDCGGDECDPCASGLSCSSDDDCQSGYCESGTSTCQDPTCTDGVQNSDESGVDCGGTVSGCDPCADNVSCNVDSDCQSRHCVDGQCRPASCDDGVLNGHETDVDCGGEECSPCRDGADCLIGSDCDSGVCDDLVCATPSCDDGVLNGGETDVDCGGLVCSPCEDGSHCLEDEDCESSVCNREECQVPACDDEVLNGGETDVDCGGVTSCDRCEPGHYCTANDDCIASAYCAGGQCVLARSCSDLLTHRPGTIDGTYTVDPDGPAVGTDAPCQVFCDMTTDGGGWTLVASSKGARGQGTFDDKASVCYEDLSTDRPARAHSGVWEGMRARIADNSDIRFSCRSNAEDAAFEVDLVFYDNDWYREITTGTDAHSSFNVEGEDNPAPARLNLITGERRSADHGWGADGTGTMAGEREAADLESFAVDFDGPGLGGYEEVNATSWGEASVVVPGSDPPVTISERRCGPLLPVDDGAWFIWVRESR